MLRRLFALIVLVIAWPQTALHGQSQPAYETRLKEAAFALSGPSVGYYPTDRLAKGQLVTVVGPPEGTFVAIAPPQGSFSWIRAADVKEQPDGQALVKTENARLRVGSNLSDARHVFQVQLKQGEMVRLLDKAFGRDGEKIVEWYKVLPHPKEVRYVRATSLQIPGEETASPVPASAPVVPNTLVSRPANAGAPVEGRRIPPAQPLPGSSAKPVFVQKNVGEGPPLQFDDDAAAPFKDRLAKIQSHIALMRSRDPMTWNTEQMGKSLEELYANSTNPKQKQQILDALVKVRHLDRLSETYRRVQRRHELVLERDRELLTLQQRRQSVVGELRPMYNVQGVLERANITIGDRPAYRIVDETGVASHFVVAPQGLAVEKYIGTRVGLIGETSNRDGLQVPVLRLQQLVPLQ